MAEPTKDDVDAIVGPATPHFAYQLRARVLELVVREAMGMAGAGIAVGLLLAIAATRGLTRLLFAVSPQDPGVLASAAVLLAVVALASSVAPALRASRVDPLAALRSD